MDFDKEINDNQVALITPEVELLPPAVPALPLTDLRALAA
jgi:hypothetical protein